MCRELLRKRDNIELAWTGDWCSAWARWPERPESTLYLETYPEQCAFLKLVLPAAGIGLEVLLGCLYVSKHSFPFLFLLCANKLQHLLIRRGIGRSASCDALHWQAWLPSYVFSCNIFLRFSKYNCILTATGIASACPTPAHVNVAESVLTPGSTEYKYLGDCHIRIGDSTRSRRCGCTPLQA